jgi:hypothetical protein
MMNAQIVHPGIRGGNDGRVQVLIGVQQEAISIIGSFLKANQL